MTSRISGFYKLAPADRLSAAAERADLGPEDISQLKAGLSLEQADKMVENVVGMFQVPLGIATNFIIDGREVLIPMATEEPSVIAAASNGARMAREAGGFSHRAPARSCAPRSRPQAYPIHSQPGRPYCYTRRS